MVATSMINLAMAPKGRETRTQKNTHTYKRKNTYIIAKQSNQLFKTATENVIHCLDDVCKTVTLKKTETCFFLKINRRMAENEFAPPP